MTSDFEKQVAQTIKKYGMFEKTDRLCVAFSGGRDSTALLECIFQMGYNVRACHVNHRIRGDEAERDERFCRDFCSRRGIELDVIIKDVPAIAKKLGKGLEETAREVRYAAFDEILSSGKAERVLTAHHARDNLETFLFELARGAGSGACGIPPVRGGYVRPMIECPPEAIDGYIAEHGLSFVTDSTNSDTAYSRNLIRAQAIPALERVNEGLYEHISAYLDGAARDAQFLDSLTPDIRDMSIKDIKALPDPLRTRAIKRFLEAGGIKGSSRRHIDAFDALVRTGKGGASLDLPGGGVYVDGERIKIGKKPSKKEFFYPLTSGENTFDEIEAKIFITKEPLTQKTVEYFSFVYKKLIYTRLFSDTIDSAYIRSVKPQDAFVCRGMTHKVKKLLSASGMGAEECARLPVFCDGEGIVWLPGCAVRDNAY